jgi:putative dehydrogenase
MCKLLSSYRAEIEEFMSPVVAVVAPGAMGAAVGKRLADNGLKVLTSLEGRSAETAARAKAAGMVAASDKEIAVADFILSILPPGDALSLAERFVPALTASNAKPVYVDCNAINPKTVERVAAAIAPTGSAFVDAGIIGPPPKPVQPDEDKLAGNTRIYASGDAAARFAALRDYGLDIRVLDGAMSAASEMFGWLKRQLGTMPPKAYRWVAEMHEIAGFVGDDPAARELYEGAAEFFERFAEDFEADKKDASALADFLGKNPSNH